MTDSHFIKVFDVLDSGFKDWSFSAGGFLFIIIGIAIFLAPRFAPTNEVFKSKRFKFFRLFFPIFAIFWTATTFFSTYNTYKRHQKIAAGACPTVEGPIENFKPMPYSGHAMESFTVSGLSFYYSDYIITDAFNNTSSHGGPIKKDSYVRICYDPSKYQILRLEIRDFNGPLPNYSNSQITFRTPWSMPGPDGKPLTTPWFAYLFFVLYILDFLALLALFIPYLRTYTRVLSSPVSKCPIPKDFISKKKITFTKSIALLDTETNAIWLRPRGINLLQVQLMVAKLKLDESGQTIIEKEIRFSSQAPISLAFFFYAFFLMSTKSPTTLLPPHFAIFITVFFIVGLIINIKILRGRMEKIVDETLNEVRARSSF